MKIQEIFKIDAWWKLIIVVSLLLGAAALLFPISFLNPKHVFGLAIGLFLIGLSYFIAQCYEHIPAPGGFFTNRITVHNFFSILILIAGIGLTGLFMYYVVKGLIE